VKIYIKDNVVLKPTEMPLAAEKEPPPAVLPAPLVPLLPRVSIRSLSILGSLIGFTWFLL